MWKRIKNLWYLSGLDLRTSSKTQKLAKKMINEFMDNLNGKKMASIIETKDEVDLFARDDINQNP